MPGLTTFLVLLQGGKLCVCVTWDSLGGGRQWGPKSCPILSLVTDLQGSWAGRPSFADVTMRWEQQSPTDRTQGQCLRGQWMHRDCVPVWQPIFITQSLPPLPRYPATPAYPSRLPMTTLTILLSMSMSLVLAALLSVAPLTRGHFLSLSFTLTLTSVLAQTCHFPYLASSPFLWAAHHEEFQ